MNAEFIEALEAIEKEKGISKEILIDAVEKSLITACKKNFGTTGNVKVSIDRITGEVQVYTQKEVVEEVFDDAIEISLEDARLLDPRYQLEDLVDVAVTTRDFGRVAAQTAKQVVVQRIREVEREIIFDEYISREKDIVTGVIQRKERKNIIVDLGKMDAEGVLPPTEQIKTEVYNFHDRLKVYILEVKQTNKGPQIVVSRTHPDLVKRLFEQEVPEIHDGIVEIKSVSREAGSRSKIAVHSNDKDVDPVGACVGERGQRVQVIVNELHGEKIDIVKWNKDPKQFITAALSPAKVVSVVVDEIEKSAKVVVPDYQLSLAIGKEGQNARLAAKLTGWKIDIKSESQAVAAGDYIPSEEVETEE